MTEVLYIASQAELAEIERRCHNIHEYLKTLTREQKIILLQSMLNTYIGQNDLIVGMIARKRR